MTLNFILLKCCLIRVISFLIIRISIQSFIIGLILSPNSYSTCLSYIFCTPSLTFIYCVHWPEGHHLPHSHSIFVKNFFITGFCLLSTVGVHFLRVNRVPSNYVTFGVYPCSTILTWFRFVLEFSLVSYFLRSNSLLIVILTADWRVDFTSSFFCYFTVEITRLFLQLNLKIWSLLYGVFNFTLLCIVLFVFNSHIDGFKVISF